MDVVLHKIKTKVSTALPGNPLTREYELGQSIGFAGPGMLWKLFDAKKRSTQEEATIWEFEKKTIDMYPKLQRESMLELMRNGAATLTRMKHPKVLSVLQAMEESRESLAFASEPLYTSLKCAISPEYSNQDSLGFQNTFTLNDVEIKYGLIQLTEALNFLHSDCHRVHLNLVPAAIVINKFGLWKLAGFEFSKIIEPSSDSIELDASVSMWESSLMSSCQPTLVFSSPEAIMQGRVTSASDMFSFGLLICCLFNQGRSLFDNEHDYTTYRRAVKNIPLIYSTKITSLPENLREYVRMMLSMDPVIRPTALQFSQTPYFEDASMTALRSVDNMYQLDNLARSQFYKSLPSLMQTLPRRLCLFRIFPQITEDFSNPHMVPFILSVVLQIMNMVTQKEFTQYMLPRLIPVLSMREPIQIVLVLLQNLHILSEKFPGNEFRVHVLPLLHTALDVDNRAIQELCLKSLPQVGSAMELNVLKNAVLPRIQKLFFRSDILSMRIACLVCIGKLLDHLDKWIVMDEVLPFLQQIQSREPTILMIIAGIYRISFSHEKLGISCEQLACRVLPHVIPLSIESSLNLSQYMAFAELIRDMCARLEREQRAKLEQLHGVSEDSNILGVASCTTDEWQSFRSCANLMDQILHNYAEASAVVLNSHGPTDKDFVVPTSNHLTDQPNHPITKQSALTLEQKRQLAVERSQLERLKGQTCLGALEPVKTDFVSSKPIPRDLTSTLIQSNMDSTRKPVSVISKQSIQKFMSIQPPTSSVNYLTIPVAAVGNFSMSPMNLPPHIPVQPYANASWLAPVRPNELGSTNVTPATTFIRKTYMGSSAVAAGSFKPLSQSEIDDLLK